MNADQRRWISHFASTPMLLAVGATYCLGAELVLSSEQRPAQIATENVSEPANAEHDAPSMDWMLPFTQYVADPFYPLPPRLSGGMPKPRPKVRLEHHAENQRSDASSIIAEGIVERGLTSDEATPASALDNVIKLDSAQDSLKHQMVGFTKFAANFQSLGSESDDSGVRCRCLGNVTYYRVVSLEEMYTAPASEPTTVERLIELGVTSGEPLSPASKEELASISASRCRSYCATPPPVGATLNQAVHVEEDANDPFLERMMTFTKFIASGDAFRLTHSGWPTSTKYPSRIRIDDGDQLLEMEPTLVELFIKRGFPLGDWNDSPVLSWMTEPHTPDISNHLAEENFTFGGIGYSR